MAYFRDKISKLVKADGQRRSRLHDHRNEASLSAVLWELPFSLWERVVYREPQLHDPRPWIPRCAARALRAIVTPDSEIVEFGSGFSTLWWSRRVRSVTSYESNDSWRAKVDAYCQQQSISNITVFDIAALEQNAASSIAKAAVTIIDGPDRCAISQFVVKHAAPGAYIYLDNSDRAAIDPEYADAQSALLARSSWHNAYKGFPPFTLFLCEGTLFKLK